MAELKDLHNTEKFKQEILLSCFKHKNLLNAITHGDLDNAHKETLVSFIKLIDINILGPKEQLDYVEQIILLYKENKILFDSVGGISVEDRYKLLSTKNREKYSNFIRTHKRKGANINQRMYVENNAKNNNCTNLYNKLSVYFAEKTDMTVSLMEFLNNPYIPEFCLHPSSRILDNLNLSVESYLYKLKCICKDDITPYFICNTAILPLLSLYCNRAKVSLFVTLYDEVKREVLYRFANRSGRQDIDGTPANFINVCVKTKDKNTMSIDMNDYNSYRNTEYFNGDFSFSEHCRGLLLINFFEVDTYEYIVQKKFDLNDYNNKYNSTNKTTFISKILHHRHDLVLDILENYILGLKDKDLTFVNYFNNNLIPLKQELFQSTILEKPDLFALDKTEKKLTVIELGVARDANYARVKRVKYLGLCNEIYDYYCTDLEEDVSEYRQEASKKCKKIFNKIQYGYIIVFFDVEKGSKKIKVEFEVSEIIKPLCFKIDEFKKLAKEVLQSFIQKEIELKRWCYLSEINEIQDNIRECRIKDYSYTIPASFKGTYSDSAQLNLPIDKNILVTSSINDSTVTNSKNIIMSDENLSKIIDNCVDSNLGDFLWDKVLNRDFIKLLGIVKLPLVDEYNQDDILERINIFKSKFNKLSTQQCDFKIEYRHAYKYPKKPLVFVISDLPSSTDHLHSSIDNKTAQIQYTDELLSGILSKRDNMGFNTHIYDESVKLGDIYETAQEIYHNKKEKKFRLKKNTVTKFGFVEVSEQDKTRRLEKKLEHFYLPLHSKSVDTLKSVFCAITTENNMEMKNFKLDYLSEPIPVDLEFSEVLSQLSHKNDLIIKYLEKSSALYNVYKQFKLAYNILPIITQNRGKNNFSVCNGLDNNVIAIIGTSGKVRKDTDFFPVAFMSKCTTSFFNEHIKKVYNIMWKIETLAPGTPELTCEMFGELSEEYLHLESLTTKSKCEEILRKAIRIYYRHNIYALRNLVSKTLELKESLQSICNKIRDIEIHVKKVIMEFNESGIQEIMDLYNGLCTKEVVFESDTVDEDLIVKYLSLFARDISSTVPLVNILKEDTDATIYQTQWYRVQKIEVDNVIASYNSIMLSSIYFLDLLLKNSEISDPEVYSVEIQQTLNSFIFDSFLCCNLSDEKACGYLDFIRYSFSMLSGKQFNIQDILDVRFPNQSRCYTLNYFLNRYLDAMPHIHKCFNTKITIGEEMNTTKIEMYAPFLAKVVKDPQLLFSDLYRIAFCSKVHKSEYHVYKTIFETMQTFEDKEESFFNYDIECVIRIIAHFKDFFPRRKLIEKLEEIMRTPLIDLSNTASTIKSPFFSYNPKKKLDMILYVLDQAGPDTTVGDLLTNKILFDVLVALARKIQAKGDREINITDIVNLCCLFIIDKLFLYINSHFRSELISKSGDYKNIIFQEDSDTLQKFSVQYKHTFKLSGDSSKWSTGDHTIVMFAMIYCLFKEELLEASEVEAAYKRMSQEPIDFAAGNDLGENISRYMAKMGDRLLIVPENKFSILLDAKHEDYMVDYESPLARAFTDSFEKDCSVSKRAYKKRFHKGWPEGFFNSPSSCKAVISQIICDVLMVSMSKNIHKIRQKIVDSKIAQVRKAKIIDIIDNIDLTDNNLILSLSALHSDDYSNRLLFNQDYQFMLAIVVIYCSKSITCIRYNLTKDAITSLMCEMTSFFEIGGSSIYVIIKKVISLLRDATPYSYPSDLYSFVNRLQDLVGLGLPLISYNLILRHIQFYVDKLYSILPNMKHYSIDYHNYDTPVELYGKFYCSPQDLINFGTHGNNLRLRKLEKCPNILRVLYTDFKRRTGVERPLNKIPIRSSNISVLNAITKRGNYKILEENQDEDEEYLDTKLFCPTPEEKRDAAIRLIKGRQGVYIYSEGSINYIPTVLFSKGKKFLLKYDKQEFKSIPDYINYRLTKQDNLISDKEMLFVMSGLNGVCIESLDNLRQDYERNSVKVDPYSPNLVVKRIYRVANKLLPNEAEDVQIKDLFKMIAEEDTKLDPLIRILDSFEVTRNNKDLRLRFLVKLMHKPRYIFCPQTKIVKNSYSFVNELFSIHLPLGNYDYKILTKKKSSHINRTVEKSLNEDLANLTMIVEGICSHVGIICEVERIKHANSKSKVEVMDILLNYVQNVYIRREFLSYLSIDTKVLDILSTVNQDSKDLIQSKPFYRKLLNLLIHTDILPIGNVAQEVTKLQISCSYDPRGTMYLLEKDQKGIGHSQVALRLDERGIFISLDKITYKYINDESECIKQKRKGKNTYKIPISDTLFNIYLFLRKKKVKFEISENEKTYRFKIESELNCISNAINQHSIKSIPRIKQTEIGNFIIEI